MSPARVVLLVESSRDDREMYAEFLRLHGVAAVEAGSTTDALALAAAADLIVTELRVRGAYDGLELVRRLRENPATRGKPIIVVTASALEHDRQHAADAGCDAFLVKPCLPQALLFEIQRMLPGPPPPESAAGGLSNPYRRS